LEFWKLNIMRNEMYTKAIGPHIEYKEGILESHLSKPLPKQSPILLEGFEPFSNWKVNYVQFYFFQLHLSLRIKKIQLPLHIVGQRV
jgi:hypothetical protein